MNYKRFYFLYFTTSLLFLSWTTVRSQNVHFPKIGEICPDFILNNIKYYKDSKLRISDLKGKYVILDFWATGCGACIDAFPKMNALQQKYNNKLDVILIGFQEKNRDVSKFYDLYKKKYQLDLISAYDSLSFKNFVPFGVPHLVWINKEGVIKAITTTEDISEHNVDKFIKDEDFQFTDASRLSRMTEMNVDMSRPLLINGNGGSDTSYLFRSVLSKWKSGMGNRSVQDINSFKNSHKISGYQAVKVALPHLYLLAFFGEYYDKSNNQDIYFNPIINIKDSALFDNNSKNLYSYSLHSKERGVDKNSIMRLMQGDLRNYFGFDARVIYKNFPCYNLIIINKEKTEKLRVAPGGLPSNTWMDESTQNFFRNQPIKDILMTIKYKLRQIDLIYNETGIEGPVSFDIEAEIYDLESVRKGLQKNGFDLVASARKMRVLEINDPEPVKAEANN